MLLYLFLSFGCFLAYNKKLFLPQKTTQDPLYVFLITVIQFPAKALTASNLLLL